MANGFKSSVAATPVTRKFTPAANAARAAIGGKPDPIEVYGVICYPSLVEPDSRAGDKYNALILITDPDSQQALRDLVATVSEQTFRTPELPPGAHNPLRSVDERTVSGELAFKNPVFRVKDGMVIRVKTGFAPVCVWGPKEIPIDASQIRGGDHVIVEVAAYGFNNQSMGVSLSFNRVLLVRKGEVPVERGSGGGANVRRIDRSNLRFGDDPDSLHAEAA